MFTDIVSNLDTLSGIEKTLMMSMAETYERHLPHVLYLNHYELAEHLGFTANQWKDFLKTREIDRAIEVEVANLAEIAARQALQRLQSGEAKSADIQAAKELLANSKLLKQKTEQPTRVVITRIPPKEKEETQDDMS